MKKFVIFLTQKREKMSLSKKSAKRAKQLEKKRALQNSKNNDAISYRSVNKKKKMTADVEVKN